MLIDLAILKDRYKMNITGVLHVGAHLGEEAQKYADCGIRNVLWVEGNPDLYDRLNSVVSAFNGQRVEIALISERDDDEVTFHITRDPEGTAMSSSLLELAVHKIHAPWVKEVEQKTLKTVSIDTLLGPTGWNGMNLINLDIQGAELLALKGAETFLHTCDYIYTEVNTNYLYKDCVLLPELDAFLTERGYLRVETVMTPAEWGDALYIRRPA